MNESSHKMQNNCENDYAATTDRCHEFRGIYNTHQYDAVSSSSHHHHQFSIYDSKYAQNNNLQINQPFHQVLKITLKQDFFLILMLIALPYFIRNYTSTESSKNKINKTPKYLLLVFELVFFGVFGLLFSGLSTCDFFIYSIIYRIAKFTTIENLSQKLKISKFINHLGRLLNVLLVFFAIFGINQELELYNIGLIHQYSQNSHDIENECSLLQKMKTTYKSPIIFQIFIIHLSKTFSLYLSEKIKVDENFHSKMTTICKYQFPQLLFSLIFNIIISFLVSIYSIFVSREIVGLISLGSSFLEVVRFYDKQKICREIDRNIARKIQEKEEKQQEQENENEIEEKESDWDELMLNKLRSSTTKKISRERLRPSKLSQKYESKTRYSLPLECEI